MRTSAAAIARVFQLIASVTTNVIIRSRFGLCAVLGSLSLLVLGAAHAADDAVAIVHINVVPMDSERTLRDQTVLVRNGLIVGIGPRFLLQLAASLIGRT